MTDDQFSPYAQAFQDMTPLQRSGVRIRFYAQALNAGTPNALTRAAFAQAVTTEASGAPLPTVQAQPTAAARAA